MRKRLCLRGQQERNRRRRAVGPQGSVWTPLSGVGFGWCCVEPEVTAGNPHVPLRTWDTQRAGTDLPHLTAASAHVVRICPGMGSSGTDSQLPECCRLFPWGGWGGVVGVALVSLRALVPELLWCRLFVLLHV